MDLRDLVGIAGSEGTAGAMNSIPGYKNLVGNALEATKDQYGEMRKAGAILKANPLSAILTELIFPPPAYGSLTDEIKRGGYGVAPDQVFTGPPGSYKYDGTIDRHMPDMPRLPDMGGPEPRIGPDMGGPEPDDRRFDKIPEVFPTRTMDFRDANSNGIDDRDEPGYNSRPDFLGSFGKMELDPGLMRTLKQQQSQMDAGISGTFAPVR